MKKIYYLLAATVMMMTLGACSLKEDPIFDQSASQRADENIETVRKVLKTAANGWLMEFYGNLSMGGYNVMVKFEGDTATIASEKWGTNHPAGLDANGDIITAASHYKLEQSMGTVLSFDDYNPIFHYYSMPNNPDYTYDTAAGLAGDFEFRVMHASADSIVLRGKKSNNKIMMTPIPAEKKWEDVVNEATETENYMASRSYTLVGETVTKEITATSNGGYRSLVFEFRDKYDQKQTVVAPYIVKADGFHFYSSVDVDGFILDGLDKGETDDYFVFHNNPGLRLDSYMPTLAENLATGTWYMRYGSVGEYAGQTITVRVDGTDVSVEVPQRAVLPDMELDYYSETLGFIPKDDTGRLLILTEGSADYVSAAPRLIDGKFINSGMTMNYAVRVIPGETLLLKIAAGEDEFASLPLTVNVPAAPEVPEVMTEISVTADGAQISGFDYEIMALSGGGADIAELAKMYAFSGTDVFEALAAARYGTDDAQRLSALLSGEFGSSASDSEGLYAVRYAATETAFASKVMILTIIGDVLMGDVNNDGMVDGVDASLILVHNANATNGEPSPIEEKFLSRADYNGDGLIDPIDASLILIYNADNS